MSSPAPNPQQQPTTWDAVAPTYAEDAHYFGAFTDEAVASLPLAAGDRVLDLATGPGQVALSIADRVARVDAVDFSPGMIDQLRARAAAAGLTNIEAAVMDAHQLGFDDASFDAAFCLFAFFFFDRARAFDQLHRVLRPGGRLLIATWSTIDRRPAMGLAFEAVAEALPQFPRPGKGDLQEPDECVREMTAAGFTDVTARRFTASVQVESPEHYLALVTRSGAPFALMKQKVPAPAWDAMMATLLEAMRKRIPAGGTELSAEAILTIGTRS